MVQTKILTRELDGSNVDVVTRDGSEASEATMALQGGVGTLALGKPGDVIETAYGPVARPYRVAADTAFGTFIANEGILVNANDCPGIAGSGDPNPFDTKTLKAGQLGAVLVSGGVVVLGSQVAAIKAAMNVNFTDAPESPVATEVYVIEVNGFKPAA